MSTRCRWVVAGLVLAGTTGLLSGAEADSPKHRWVAPAVRVVGYSGAPVDVTKSDWVRVNKTMSAKPQDRVYGIRGITWYGYNGCGIKALPALLHPTASASVRNDRFGCTEPGKPHKTAQLPNGYVLTALQVCDNGKSRWSKELKGLRLWGHKLSSSGRPIQPTGPIEVKRNGCKKWRQKISCPSGKIVVSFDTYAPKNSTFRLRCASVAAE